MDTPVGLSIHQLLDIGVGSIFFLAVKNNASINTFVVILGVLQLHPLPEPPPGELVETQTAGPDPQNSDLVSLGWGPRLGISNKFPATRLRPHTLREPRPYRWVFITHGCYCFISCSRYFSLHGSLSCSVVVLIIRLPIFVWLLVSLFSFGLLGFTSLCPKD